jgi:uncharacterized membrane protein
VRVCKAIAATVVVAATLIVLGPAQPVDAQSIGFHVDTYTIDYAIQSDGTVAATEVIEVDFASEPHHGIFRYIPVRFDYEPNRKYERIYKISNIHVAATGVSAHNSISDTGPNKVFKIGDKDKTVTGTHTYTITYKITGALNSFREHDEFYWNATGNHWEIPIDEAVVHVTAPSGMQQVACFTGFVGSRQTCESAQLTSSTGATFSEHSLYPGDGISVVVSLQKGVVPAASLKPILDEKWSIVRAFSVTPATGGAAIAILLLALGFVARFMWRTGRDRRATASGTEELRPLTDDSGGPVQYRPPDDSRPAQVGVLNDERADPLDVTATIVDFGVRGFLTIEEIEKGGLFHKADWQLTKLKDDDGTMLTYERRLFTGLFDKGDERKLSELKNTFASDLRAVQDSLYADCVSHGWFARRPDRVRATYLGLGIVAFLLSVGVLVALIALTHAALVGVPLVIAAFVLLAGHGRMPARTAKGSAALDQTLGFREYIATAEADRMKFAEEENIFAKYLPYAIVFHETERWAKAFHGIYGDNPPPGMGWYVPYGSWNAFTFGSFAGSMSSFTVQTAGTIVSTPSASGSSGFGGGGFSGGGGGGGGGGGW